MSQAPRPASGKRILIVDDEEDLSAMLALRIEAMGFGKVECAASVEQGLVFLEARAPDLVLLDLRMPGMDGWQLCARLKASERTRDIPVLILTADQSESLEEKVREAGAAGLLHKPFEREELESLLSSALAGKPAAARPT